jgi:hypothetical protein
MKAWWWLIATLLIFGFGVVFFTVVMITLIPGLVMLLDRLEEFSRRFAKKHLEHRSR